MELTDSVITNRTLKDVVLVYLLLFVSGSIRFSLFSEQYLIIVFIGSLLAWFLFSDRNINEKFVIYVCVFSGFLLIIDLYTGGGLSMGSIIGTVMRLVLAYLIIKTVGARFVETYIKVIVFLAVFSLFGFLTDQLYLFDAVIHKLPHVGDNGFGGIFYTYRHHYVGYNRNNSIFFEPGAYQGFLNMGLFLLLFTKSEFSKTRRWVYISTLLITLFTTFSTTGYLTFATMFGFFILKSNELSTSSKALLGGVVLAVIVVFSAQFKSVIVDKLASYTSIEDITDSRNRRSFDALVDMEIIKKHIFGAGHKKYFETFGSIGVIGEGTGSSNGITKTFAVYGLPFGIFLFGSYYLAIVRLFGGPLSSLVPFGMLMMFFLGESYFVFAPFCLAIIAAAFVFGGMKDVEYVGCNAEADQQT
jgi:uncharacterized membrane protein